MSTKYFKNRIGEAGFQPLREDFSHRVAKITFYSFVRLKFGEIYGILK